MFQDPADPDDLKGDALTQWYQRSPADIDQARQAAFAQRYNDFFGHPPNANLDPGIAYVLPTSGKDIDPGINLSVPSAKAPDPGFDMVQVGPNRWATRRIRMDAPSSDDGSDLADPSRGETGDSSPRIQLASNPGFCAACHGGPLSPPPPALSSPPYWTKWTPGPNLTPRKPAKPHPPQCAMQNMQDSRICSREPGDAWKTICFRSATEREAHCITSGGELRFPPLETHDRF